MSRGYLVDTSVLSLLAPGRLAPDSSLAAWLRQNDEGLHISAITVAEIEQGVCKLRRSGGVERAEALSAWLDALIVGLGERVLAFDAGVGRVAGRLSDKALAAGRHPGFADVAIAATASVHDLVVLTCNGKHLAPLGVEWIDPVEVSPDR